MREGIVIINSNCQNINNEKFNCETNLNTIKKARISQFPEIFVKTRFFFVYLESIMDSNDSEALEKKGRKRQNKQ